MLEPQLWLCAHKGCFLCYKFKCTCNSCYVGRTKKVLRVRAEQHRTFSYAKKTYYHINRCPVYVKKLREFEEIHFTKKSTITYKKKMRDKFFMEHFEIVQKNFRFFDDLKKAEEFYIRIYNPDLNQQKKHDSFSLFWFGQQKFLFLAHIISAETLYFLDSVFFTDIETFVLLNI